MKHIKCRALITLLYLTIAIDVCQGDHEPAEEDFARKYPFSVTLHEGFYHLYWNFSTVDETIQFAVKVKTTGWVGFGISSHLMDKCPDRTLLLHGLMERRHTFRLLHNIRLSISVNYGISAFFKI